MSISLRFLLAGILVAVVFAGLAGQAVLIQESTISLLSQEAARSSDLARNLSDAKSDAVGMAAYFEGLREGSDALAVSEKDAERMRKVAGQILEIRKAALTNPILAGSRLASIGETLSPVRFSSGTVSIRAAANVFDEAAQALREAVERLGGDDIAQRDSAAAEAQSGRLSILIVAAVGLIVLGLVALLFAVTSLRPVRSSVSLAEDVANGRVGDIPAAGGPAEVRRLLTALRTIRDTIEKGRTEKTVELDTIKARAEHQRSVLGNALDHIDIAICVLDPSGLVSTANRAFVDRFGVDEHRMAASALFDNPEIYARLREKETATLVREESDGRVTEVRRQGLATGSMVLSFSDITDRYDAERKLSHLVDHDALTNLMNRVAFLRKVDGALGNRQMTTVIGVLHVRGMKRVNDAHGHLIGDGLLRQVAARLLKSFPNELVAARLGNDEFAFLVDSRRRIEPAEIAKKALSIFEEAFDIGGLKLNVPGTLGLNEFDLKRKVSDLDPEDALRDCELAAQTAKRDGDASWNLFDPAMREEQSRRLDLERDLRRAIAEESLHLVFQPLVNVQERAVYGFEALVRWNHPQHGPISPADFIPIAEESGLIVPLGNWVLRHACQVAASWPTRYSIAVNLSAVQFKQPDLVEEVLRALADSGMSPNCLVLEVTESLFIGEGNSVVDKLNALRQMGVSIAMDDFGTGYSSLGYLSRFPFDKIKIDQSFVRDMQRPENMAIIRSIIGLSSALGVRVVAEGIETVAQMQTLAEHGCAEMQGYLFASPKRVEELALTVLKIDQDWKDKFPRLAVAA